LLNFLIISWVLFLAITALSKLQKAEKPAPAKPSPEVELLTEIRDLLKK
jgi:large conductance mechanosensitive channel